MFINHGRKGVQLKGEMGPDKSLKEGERVEEKRLKRLSRVKKEEWWKSAKNARQLIYLQPIDRILDGR